MAKKTKDETVELLYLKEDPIEDAKKTNKKKQTKTKKKNKNVPKNTIKENEIINLDNEIIIGLTPTPKQKETKTKNENKKEVANKSKKKETKKTEKKVTHKANTKSNIKTNTKTNVKNEAKSKNNINSKISKKAIIRIKILKWTGIAILLVGIVIFFMLSPIFNVKQINVEGIQKLTSEEIINLSQIKLGENTFKLKTSGIIERIQSNTYVDTVQITRELPSTLKLTVKERTPRYIIELVDKYAYIDSKGYILEISTEKLELPILNGYGTSIENIIDFENTKKLSDEDCKRVEIVDKIYEVAEYNNILTYITSINIEDITDIKANLDTEKKVVHFGDCSSANMRILYLKKMIEEESGKEGEAFINGDLHTQKPKPYFREKI